MISLTALLTSPEPDDPQDGQVARQYKEKPALYKQTASFWTYVFAIENKTAEMIRQFAPYECKLSRIPCNENIPNQILLLFFAASVQQVCDRVHCDRGAAISALSCNN